MRDEFDPAGPRTYTDVASWMLAVHDDLLDDDEDHPGTDMTEDEALEIIRREYVSGTCGAYAVALHDATGLQIVGINGGMHIAVMTGDGEIVDYMGRSSAGKVMKRYGMTSAPIATWTRGEAVDHVMMGEISDDPWNDIALAAYVLTLRGLPEGVQGTKAVPADREAQVTR